MMARAIRGGVKVDFLLADVWFGTKAMVTIQLIFLTSMMEVKKMS
jgi:hypothetical protein